MSKKNINKTSIIKSVAKMAADKDLVRNYIKGSSDLKSTKAKGIKFAKPI